MKKVIDSETTNCFVCIHRSVCGMYDALWDAIVIIQDFNETAHGCDDRLCETLAANCQYFEK